VDETVPRRSDDKQVDHRNPTQLGTTTSLSRRGKRPQRRPCHVLYALKAASHRRHAAMKGMRAVAAAARKQHGVSLVRGADGAETRDLIQRFAGAALTPIVSTSYTSSLCRPL